MKSTTLIKGMILIAAVGILVAAITWFMSIWETDATKSMQLTSTGFLSFVLSVLLAFGAGIFKVKLDQIKEDNEVKAKKEAAAESG